jgi:hypothetical protein
MKYTKITMLATMLFCICSLSAQNSPKISPFKGFHLGVTYQAELVQKCSMLPLVGDYEYPPIPLNTYGWELGLEMSYHFAKYFGVSFGLNYGYVFSFGYKYHMTEGLQLYDGYEPYLSKGRYEKFLGETIHKKEWVFPLKLELHFPLCRNLYFTTDIGIKIKGVENSLIYEKGDFGSYEIGVSVQTEPATPDSIIYPAAFFDILGKQPLYGINIDLVIGAGLYYKLPYGDLLRLTTGVNLAFKDFMSGYYGYWLHDTYGTFSARHNFLYTQLSYIHTFNYKKARNWLKRNNISFSSKKERRRHIYEMLNLNGTTYK